MKIELPWLTLAVQVVTGLTTSTVAVLVFVISRRQAKTASEKFRLDLYDRRFRIYSRTLGYRNSVLTLDLSKPGNESQNPNVATSAISIPHPPLGNLWTEPEAYATSRRAFWEACDEARFLFSAESKIYAHLVKFREAGSEMESRILIMEGARQTNATVGEQNEAIECRNEQFDLIQTMVPTLSALMRPYMNF